MNLLETVFTGVVDLSWRCSWVILLVLALRPCLSGRIPARVVFWIWIALSLRLLLPVSISSPWSPFAIPPDVERSVTSASAAAPTPDLRPADPVTSSLSLQPSHSGTAGASAGLLADRGLPFGAGLVALWAAGAAALLVVRLGAQARFHCALRRSRTRPSPLIQRLVAEEAAAAGLRPLPVWLTQAVSAPALHGILRPQLLFPPGFLEQLTPDELRFVVAHELAHARRRDLLAQAALHAALVVHWFNPLVWIAVRLARRDCELACDETVLDKRLQPERVSYGAALLRTISVVSCRVAPPAALGVVESKRELKQRLTQITARRSSARLVTVAGCTLVAAGLVVSLTREARAETPTMSSPPTRQPTAVRTRPRSRRTTSRIRRSHG